MAYSKEWYEKNREAIREAQKRYRNKEEYRAKRRVSNLSEEEREEVNRKHREYYEKNKERVKEINRRSYERRKSNNIGE